MRVGIQIEKEHWVTSDLHLNHKNVSRYSDRPFETIEEMNETLIANWNSVVGPNDVVFNLGDFAFCNQHKIIEFLERLNGQQYYILGNHDKMMLKKKVRDYAKETGKIKFYDVIETRYKGHHIFMSHYSHRVWNKHHHGALHLYGHSHGSLPGLGKSVDVGVDSKELFNNYTPLHMDTVVEYLETKEKHSLDHHE